MRKILLFAAFLALESPASAQQVLPWGQIVKSFDAAACTTGTAGTTFALQAGASSVIAFQTTFASAPTSTTIQIQESIDNTNWKTRMAPTNTAGDFGVFTTGAAFIRAYSFEKTGGGNCTVYLRAVNGTALVGGDASEATLTAILTGINTLNGTVATDRPEGGTEVDGAFGPATLNIRRDTPAPSASNGQYSTFNTNAYGALWTSSRDPCESEATVSDPVSMTTDGTLVASASGKITVICSATFVASAAEIISIWEDDNTPDSACAGGVALAGSTTEANGMSFAANGGVVNIGRIVGKTQNRNICLRISGANRISGTINWAQRAGN